jgi:hypothetical protein
MDATLAADSLIRFQSEERALSLDEKGVSTTAGNKTGSVPSCKVARIDADPMSFL